VTDEGRSLQLIIDGLTL